MTTLIIIVLAVLIVALIWLATLPGDYEIRVSRTLPADIESVFERLRDFSTWSEWSPWILHEPDCPLSFSDAPSEEGGSYSWDGKYIGAGSMEHKALEKPHRLQQKLSFTRPFKSLCDVGFDLKETDGGTEVTWWMQASMPFLFRPMIPKIKNSITTDYDTGLALLSGVLDPASEHPKLSFHGRKELPSQNYLSKSWEGDLEDMPAAMEKGYKELLQYMELAEVKPAAPPFCLYKKIRKNGSWFAVDMAVPVPEDYVSEEYEINTFEGGAFAESQLLGSYDFLKNAWMSSISNLQMKKIKVQWRRPCLEVYMNDPGEIEHSNELDTRIYIPVK